MATVTSSHLRAVQSLARRTGALRPTTAEHIALVAFMAGALYALTRAIECRFDDERMTPDLVTMRVELGEVLDRIAKSRQPYRPWLSGFYIDSAMMRLDALGERLGTHLELSHPPLPSPHIPDAVNSMKHDVDAGIAVGWNARLERS